MDPLDEKALRRPDWTPGTPVVLADGGTWHLRRPLVRFVPNDTNPSGFLHCLGLDDGDDFQTLLDRLHEHREAIREAPDRDPSELIRAQLGVGRRLLITNYDLTTSQAARLLRFAYSAEANPEHYRIFQDVMDVAGGRGPRTLPRWYRVAGLAFGDLPWRDGMLLEDYFDSIAFLEHLVPPPASEWVDELRHQAGLASFKGIG